MTEVFIKDLVVEGRHGVHQSEKVNPQRFKVSVNIILKDTQPHISDSLDDTVDWSLIRKQIIKVVQSKSFDLIERLAQEITDKLLDNKKIKKLTVTVDKIDAFSDCIVGVKLITTA